MQTIDRDLALDFDRHYVEQTHVHSLLVTDDEVCWPDGTRVDEDEGTITLDDWRAGKLHPST